MKAQGNAGSKISLIDPANANVVSRIFIETPVLAATQDWYDPDRNETLRYRTPIWVAPADMDVVVALTVKGVAAAQAWFEAVKLEESTVATPWSPGAVGATVVDAGGVQVDGSKGGVFRYKGIDGALRSVVAGGTSGLLFAGDELTSPSVGALAVNGSPLAKVSDIPAPLPVVPARCWAFKRARSTSRRLRVTAQLTDLPEGAVTAPTVSPDRCRGVLRGDGRVDHDDHLLGHRP